MCPKCEGCGWPLVDFCDGQDEFHPKKCPIEQQIARRG